MYSFLPADGVERLIQLRARVRQRLQENAEVVGTDERFFEDDEAQKLFDLYNENSGLLDGETDNEVGPGQLRLPDLAERPESRSHPERPHSCAAGRGVQHQDARLHDSASTDGGTSPGGVLVYTRTASGYDALAWMDDQGNSVTQSQLKVLQAAECAPETPAVPRLEQHHDLVRAGVAHITAQEDGVVGGELGRPNGPRARTYDRLKRYFNSIEGTLYASPEVERAIDDIYRYPLRAAATDMLARQLRTGIDDATLAALVLSLRDDDRLSLKNEDDEAPSEPQIICSLGLRPVQTTPTPS